MVFLWFFWPLKMPRLNESAKVQAPAVAFLPNPRKRRGLKSWWLGFFEGLGWFLSRL